MRGVICLDVPTQVRRPLRYRVVHGGGRSAPATNRPTAAVDNSCQMFRIAPNRPQIVRNNRIFLLLFNVCLLLLGVFIEPLPTMLLSAPLSCRWPSILRWTWCMSA